MREFVGGSMDVSVPDIYFWTSLYSITSIAGPSYCGADGFMLHEGLQKSINQCLFILDNIIFTAYLFSTECFLPGLILTGVSFRYLTVDPITVSIILTADYLLSKPIGGLTFGIVFWKISRTLSYKEKYQTYMIISGWGILLIFATNQGISQSLDPISSF